MLYAKRDKEDLVAIKLETKDQFVDFVFDKLYKKETWYIYNREYAGFLCLEIKNGAYYEKIYLDPEWYRHLVFTDILREKRLWHL